MPLSTTATTVIVAALLALVPTDAIAGGFLTTATDGGVTSTDPMIARRRAVEVDPEAIGVAAGPILEVDLFHDVSVLAILERRIDRGPDQWTWTGSLHGEDGGWFAISVANDAVAADFMSPSFGAFQLRSARNGGFEVLEISPAAAPTCACVREQMPTGFLPPAPRVSGQLTSPTIAGGAAACAEDGSIIDVLVVHSPAATTGAGGPAAMTALANLAVDQTNMALSNSVVPITVRLAGVEEVTFTETGFAGSTLEGLIAPGDGFIDEVHALRDAYRADVVSMITETLDACGFARVAVGPGPTPLPESAFNLVARLCTTAPIAAFAHEFGHSCGLMHDWLADQCDAAAQPFGKGYVAPDESFGTIMSSHPAPNILHFSNPDVLYLGEPTGTATGESEPANAALSLTIAAQTVAQYRSLDCNGNGQCDDDDILLGASSDCDANGVPDECDLDYDRNGSPDACDIAGGAPDVNGNGIPDVAEPSIVYVDATANGAATGLSWSDAYPDLQSAMTVARASDGVVTEIRVAAGAYAPGTVPQRAATFRLISGVEVIGGFPAGGGTPAQRDPAAHLTILSGDLAGNDGADFLNHDENCITVLTGSDADATSSIDGFVIEGGWADPDFSGCWFTPYNAGGGIRIFGGSPNVRNCVIRGNRTRGDGGGIYVTHTSQPTFTGCDVIDNRAIGGGGGGASVTSSNGAISMIDCRFARNESVLGGGGISAICDHGLYLNCTFEENVSATSGGAFRNTGACDGSPQFINTIFRNNVSGTTGGAVYSYGAGGPFKEPAFINCTIYGNTAANTGGIACISAPGARIVNTILWGNSDGTETGEPGQIRYQVSSIDNTCVQGWTGDLGGTGNFGDDPMLIDALGDPADLRLQPGSPCIDAGDAAELPSDATDLDDDGDTLEALPLDADGASRVVGSTVDLGAYETQSAGCPGDTNGDNAVDVDDLVNVILDFGTDGSGNGGDVDSSGLVDVDDLVFVILSWNGC